MMSEFTYHEEEITTLQDMGFDLPLPLLLFCSLPPLGFGKAVDDQSFAWRRWGWTHTRPPSGVEIETCPLSLRLSRPRFTIRSLARGMGSTLVTIGKAGLIWM